MPHVLLLGATGGLLLIGRLISRLIPSGHSADETPRPKGRGCFLLGRRPSRYSLKRRRPHRAKASIHRPKVDI